ncbi:hypothetical protein SUGI_0095820 [Cryptomeria japonica]|nr:hypothetical protein SUGI_0095820 [Cryptomeria japonica]
MSPGLTWREVRAEASLMHRSSVWAQVKRAELWIMEAPSLYTLPALSKKLMGINGALLASNHFKSFQLFSLHKWLKNELAVDLSHFAESSLDK